jgi:malonyl CoA-acyl carrier protein transacylase
VIAGRLPGQASQRVGRGKTLAGALRLGHRTVEDAGRAPDVARGARDLRLFVGANVDAAPGRERAAAIGPLVRRVLASVLWEAAVGCLASERVTTYVEVGPGTVPSGLVRTIHRDAAAGGFGGPRRSRNGRIRHPCSA